MVESVEHAHWWFSGRMLACHAGGPGSIPGQCNFYSSDETFTIIVAVHLTSKDFSHLGRENCHVVRPTAIMQENRENELYLTTDMQLHLEKDKIP